MNPYYAETAARAAHRCEYRRAPEVAFNFPFEVEHVTPPGVGGTDDPKNLALSCRSCNIFKGNQLNAIDADTGETSRIFHGLTAIVTLLRMNTQPQLNARRWWRTLQLFP